MLRIAHDLLPQSLLSYVAFRVAARQTMDTLSQYGPEGRPDDPADLSACLGQIPFLREVALPVQLDLLAETWDRHLAPRVFEATLLDESMVYAACELAANLVLHEPERITWALRGGPIDVSIAVDEFLASELRSLYLRLSNDGDFLLISQLLDFDPEESADWKERLGLDAGCLESLFDVLGRWHASPELVGNLRGLVSIAEAGQLARLLGVSLPA